MIKLIKSTPHSNFKKLILTWEMKKMILVSLFLAACGTSSPFQRGKIVDGGGSRSDDGPSNDKPVDELLSKVFFDDNIAPKLTLCKGCHGDPAFTYTEAVNLSVEGDLAKSVFYQRPVNGFEGHPKKLTPTSELALAMKVWITGK